MSENVTTFYCVNHPNVETSLLCNRCERPICPRCAVLTPTGYRCKDCVRGQQKVFETAQWYDYLLGAGVAAFLSFIGSLIVSAVGFFTIFLAPIAGVIIGEAARAVIRRRRSMRLFRVITGAAVLGSLPLLLMILIGLAGGGGSFRILLPLLWQGLYTFTVASTVYYRLGGIQMR